MKNTAKTFWFRPRSSGYAWGMPQHRNGWIAYGLFIGIWLAALLWVSTAGSSVESISRNTVLVASVIFLADTLWFAAVVLSYTDKRRTGKEVKHADKPKSD